MRKKLTNSIYILIVLLILMGITITIFRGCGRLGGCAREPMQYRVNLPFGWKPFGKTIAEPTVTEAPTEYTAGHTSTPVEPKKERPRPWYHAPPSTLAEGGDVRELIPEVDFFGPEPGSAADEAIDAECK